MHPKTSFSATPGFNLIRKSANCDPPIILAVLPLGLCIPYAVMMLAATAAPKTIKTYALELPALGVQKPYESEL